MLYIHDMNDTVDMVNLTNHRSNVGRDMDPDSMSSYGDNPTKVRTIETRPPYMEVADRKEGDIEEGVSMEQSLYELDPITHPHEGMNYGIRSY